MRTACTHSRATGRSGQQAISQVALAPGTHAVVSADREGIIRDWNETAEHIFGHSAGPAIGQTLDLIIPEEERANHWRNFRRAMATGVLNYRPDHVLDIKGPATEWHARDARCRAHCHPRRGGRSYRDHSIMREVDLNIVA